MWEGIRKRPSMSACCCAVLQEGDYDLLFPRPPSSALVMALAFRVMFGLEHPSNEDTPTTGEAQHTFRLVRYTHHRG